jgi:hypothetical protein
MAAITAASLIYSEPYVTKVGGLLFTVTNIEIPATTEEYEVGGFEIEPAKLGLSDGLIAGPYTEGGFVTSKGGLKNGAVGAIWCTPLVEKKVGKAEAAGKFIPAVVVSREGKNPVVQCYTTGAAVKNSFLEILKAEGGALKEYTMTVFAFGK